MTIDRGLTIPWLLLSTLFGLPQLLANPSHDDPDAPLAVHGSGVPKELHAKAASLYSAAARDARTQFEAVAAGRGERLSGKVIGQTRAKIRQYERLGSQLEIYGEPAGTDFHLRFSYLARPQWWDVIKPFAAAPSSQNYVNSIRLAIRRQTPARMKTLEKLQKMVAEQKWQAAEDELYGLFDGLEVGTCFLSDQERQDIEAPFGEVRAAIDRAMRLIRSQEAAQLLGQSRAQQLPDLAVHIKEIREAAAAIAATGLATWDGQQVTGPQLVQHLGTRWTKVHVACLHCRALDWAMQPLFQTAGDNAARISPETLDRDYSQFCATLVESIDSLIRADAARVSGDEAAERYVEYLDSLAPLLRQVVDENTVQGWDAALRQLAAKSPEFDREVVAYDTATREILRWRARTAMSIAQSRSDRFQTLDKHLYDATLSKGESLGLFPERPDGQLAPRLITSSPAIMTMATPRLMGKQATAFDVIRVSPTSSSAIARYRARTYATIAAGFDLSAELSALKSDLMISEQSRGLTLAAVASVYSAEMGDLAAVGGEIVGHHLEGLITRFAALPPAASILVPLGVLPQEDIKQRLVSQMLMRFDLRPSWVQHEHFCLDLPATAAE